MKNTLLTLALFTTTLFVNAQGNFHSFITETIDGKPFDLAQLKGKKVLVVNVASKCGLTPQYKELQELYERYGSNTFTLIAFPANNFLNQEPGTNAEVKEFCSSNYNVTFPVMTKISVKGDDIDPIYKWLTSKQQNGVMDAKVTWNFQKFLIDENGNLVDMIPPRESVLGDKVIRWIQGK